MRRARARASAAGLSLVFISSLSGTKQAGSSVLAFFYLRRVHHRPSTARFFLPPHPPLRAFVLFQGARRRRKDYPSVAEDLSRRAVISSSRREGGKRTRKGWVRHADYIGPLRVQPAVSFIQPMYRRPAPLSAFREPFYCRDDLAFGIEGETVCMVIGRKDEGCWKLKSFEMMIEMGNRDF